MFEGFAMGIHADHARYLPLGETKPWCLSESGQQGGYTCTRPLGHEDDHAAHGPKNEMYARWPQEGDTAADRSSQPADVLCEKACQDDFDNWTVCLDDARSAIAAERERCAKVCEEAAKALRRDAAKFRTARPFMDETIAARCDGESNLLLCVAELIRQG